MTQKMASHSETECEAIFASDATNTRADSELWTASWAPEERLDTEYWVLRACGGVTSRANSAVPREGAIRNPVEALKELESFYGARGLHPQVQLPQRCRETAIGHALLTHSYTPAFPTLVQTLALQDRHDEKVEFAHPEFSIASYPAPTSAWRELYVSSDGRGDAALDECQLSILTRTPSNYIELRSGDQLLGIARLTAFEAVAALTAMVVDPAQRGRGLGRLVMRGVRAQAVSMRCSELALQVTESNVPAQRLYAGAGFHTVDSYEYYLAPL